MQVSFLNEVRRELVDLKRTRQLIRKAVQNIQKIQDKRAVTTEKYLFHLQVLTNI